MNFLLVMVVILSIFGFNKCLCTEHTDRMEETSVGTKYANAAPQDPYGPPYAFEYEVYEKHSHRDILVHTPGLQKRSIQVMSSDDGDFPKVLYDPWRQRDSLGYTPEPRRISIQEIASDIEDLSKSWDDLSKLLDDAWRQRASLQKNAHEGCMGAWQDLLFLGKQKRSIQEMPSDDEDFSKELDVAYQTRQ